MDGTRRPNQNICFLIYFEGLELESSEKLMFGGPFGGSHEVTLKLPVCQNTRLLNIY